MMNVASWIPINRPLELRRTSRADVHVAIDMTSDHHFWSGLSADMSEGGVFVATHQLLPIGARVYVQFRIDDGGEPIVALTEVRWIRLFQADGASPGLGLKFLDLEEHALRRIRAFVARRPPLLYED